ncbi:flagellar export chaperone FliS [Bryobacter aggregatus]|uniref:flagellar export chaperone FliS n=1 Tax=Bryobacter aggregatus TaxID=360054 RepID=UPI00068D5223|nr:flagellar export chaperone FliS [Bryobacter aggregatus]
MTPLAPYQTYLAAEQNFQEQRIEGASPLELTCILYEGAIQAVEQAQLFLKRGDILARGRSIARAQSIVLELMESLDRKKGGDFADRLGLLYDYLLSKLNEAHSQQSLEALQQVQKLLGDLFAAWSQIAERPDGMPRLSEESSVDLAV